MHGTDQVMGIETFTSHYDMSHHPFAKIFDAERGAEALERERAADGASGTTPSKRRHYVREFFRKRRLRKAYETLYLEAEQAKQAAAKKFGTYFSEHGDTEHKPNDGHDHLLPPVDTTRGYMSDLESGTPVPDSPVSTFDPPPSDLPSRRSELSAYDTSPENSPVFKSRSLLHRAPLSPIPQYRKSASSEVESKHGKGNENGDHSHPRSHESSSSASSSSASSSSSVSAAGFKTSPPDSKSKSESKDKTTPVDLRPRFISLPLASKKVRFLYVSFCLNVCVMMVMIMIMIMILIIGDD